MDMERRVRKIMLMYLQSSLACIGVEPRYPRVTNN